MGQKTSILSVTYEFQRISSKKGLPYLKRVFRLSCVVCWSVGKLIIIEVLSESFRGYRNDRFFKFVSVAVLEFRLPRELGLPPAGRSAPRAFASGLEKPLLARKIPAGRRLVGNQKSRRDLSLSPYECDWQKPSPAVFVSPGERA